VAIVITRMTHGTHAVSLVMMVLRAMSGIAETNPSALALAQGFGASQPSRLWHRNVLRDLWCYDNEIEHATPKALIGNPGRAFDAVDY
jgi:hypothetical protein